MTSVTGNYLGDMVFWIAAFIFLGQAVGWAIHFLKPKPRRRP